MPIQLLYIDPWPSRQSEILCTGCTGENERKQSRGWTEMCGCYQMIYAWNTESQSWVSLRSQSWERQQMVGRLAWAASQRVAHSRLLVKYILAEKQKYLVRPWRLHRVVWLREKVMGQYGCLYSFLCICLSPTESFDSKKNKENMIFLTMCCSHSYSLYIRSLWVNITILILVYNTFPRELERTETALYTTWNRVDLSISKDDNHYSISCLYPSLFLYIYICVCVRVRVNLCPFVCEYFCLVCGCMYAVGLCV